MDDGYHYRKHTRIGDSDVITDRRKRKKRKKRAPEEGGDYDFENPTYNGHVSEKSSRSDYASLSNVDVVKRSPSRETEPQTTMSMTARSLNGTIKEVKIEHQSEQQGLPSALKKHIIDTPAYSTSVYRPEDNPSLINPSFQDHVRRFVVNNITHRECKLYIRDNKKNTGACQCGRDYAWHDGRVPMANPNVHKWSAAKDTRQIPADTFGTIHFNGFGTENTRYAPYIRVENDTSVENMENVWTLINDYWHVPPPRLIISVTGGAKRFYLKNRLKQSFKRGLVNAATSTGAWVVTGGSNAGVMEFVGEAVREYMMTQGVVDQQIVALGIATWGIVDNKDALIDSESEGLFPAVYDIDELSPKTKRGVSPLDPNHSHFILVDDGSESQFGKEIEFRAKFEQYLSAKMKMVSKNNTAGVEVPVVSLVLEGGENTLNTAKSAIQSGTPVVVVNGSGRAADFIARAYKETKQKDDDTTEFPKDFDDRFEEYASYMFDWSREKDPKVKCEKMREAVKNVRSLLESRHMITVFTMDEDDTTNEVDQAILDALLKAKRSDVNTQLNLALAWNRCDVARHKILTVENRKKWQNRENRDMLYDALFTALIQDKMDFVQLFIDNGVDLKRFLTVRRLRDLYDDVVMENKYPSASTDLIRNLIQHVQLSGPAISCCKREVLVPDSPTLLKYIGRLTSYLLGDQHDIMYQGDRYEVSEADPVTPSSVSKRQPLYSRRDTSMRGWKSDFENPARELFLWAVLLNRRDLARFFWRIGKDHIGGALIASALLKSLAKEAEKDVEMDLSNDILEHSAQFEAHAVGVLGECYSKEKELTHHLLTRELETWGGVTLYSIADAAEQMDFMGHSACQTKLNKIWMGRMALYTSVWRIFLCLFLPIFLHIIKFQPEDEEEKSSQIRTRRELKSQQLGTKAELSPEQMAMENINRSTNGKQDGEHEKLVRVTCCGSCTGETGSVSWICAALYFYRSPMVKFCFHTLSYVVFLGLFSYFVMVELKSTDEEGWVSAAEYVLWGWAITLLCEEIRQIVTKDPNSLTYKVSGYFSSVWNQFDQFVHVMFVLSVILRFSLTGNSFVYARIFYCLTLLCYYLRFLQAFFVSKNVGPKVIMIQRMLTDLLFFISILIVFILAYGVVAQALRYPSADANWVLLKDAVYMPYWQMYGELFLEDLEGDVYVEVNQTTVSCTEDPEQSGCPEQNAVVIVLFAIYMMMTNVLLLNLLIAMFSYTFERVQENSETVWRYYRYSLIYEYFDRPTLAPPLIFLNHVWRSVKYVFRRCKEKEKISHDFKMVLQPEANNKLSAFERVGMENYLHNKHLLERELIDNKVQTTQDRIEKVIEDLEGIKEHMGARSDEALPSVEPATEPTVGTARGRISEEDIDELHARINNLESYMLTQQQQLDSALQLLTQIAASGGAGGRGMGGRADVPRPAFDPLVPADTTFTTLLPGTADYYGYRQPGPQIEIQDAPTGNDQSQS